MRIQQEQKGKGEDNWLDAFWHLPSPSDINTIKSLLKHLQNVSGKIGIMLACLLSFISDFSIKVILVNFVHRTTQCLRLEGTSLGHLVRCPLLKQVHLEPVGQDMSRWFWNILVFIWLSVNSLLLSYLTSYLTFYLLYFYNLSGVHQGEIIPLLQCVLNLAVSKCVRLDIWSSLLKSIFKLIFTAWKSFISIITQWFSYSILHWTFVLIANCYILLFSSAPIIFPSCLPETWKGFKQLIEAINDTIDFQVCKCDRCVIFLHKNKSPCTLDARLSASLV